MATATRTNTKGGGRREVVGSVADVVAGVREKSGSTPWCGRRGGVCGCSAVGVGKEDDGGGGCEGGRSYDACWWRRKKTNFMFFIFFLFYYWVGIRQKKIFHVCSGVMCVWFKRVYMNLFPTFLILSVVLELFLSFLLFGVFSFLFVMVRGMSCSSFHFL